MLRQLWHSNVRQIACARSTSVLRLCTVDAVNDSEATSQETQPPQETSNAVDTDLVKTPAKPKQTPKPSKKAQVKGKKARQRRTPGRDAKSSGYAFLLSLSLSIPPSTQALFLPEHQECTKLACGREYVSARRYQMVDERLSICLETLRRGALGQKSESSPDGSGMYGTRRTAISERPHEGHIDPTGARRLEDEWRTGTRHRLVCRKTVVHG